MSPAYSAAAMRAALLIALVSFWVAPGNAAALETIPRTVIALYDNRGGGIQTSYTHQLAEMPLNHLGLTVEYHDINKPLPEIAGRGDVRGILTWFLSDTEIKDPAAYVKWSLRAMDGGKKYVAMGPLGIERHVYGGMSDTLAYRFFRRIGIELRPGWIEFPFAAAYDAPTPDMLLAPERLNWTRLGYQVMRATGDKVEVHLRTREERRPQMDSDLIVTGPGGGYAAANYIFRTDDQNDEEIAQWLINPFEFFRLAFATDDLPKPDTTTIAGRRLYYSHIDGDGWNNLTQIEQYRDRQVLSAAVIMDKAVKPYPDLPVTLTLIGGDLNPKWAAVDQSRDIAKEFLALPQVEAGSHTYSHPFYWQIFADGHPENEIPYLSHYRQTVWTPKKGMKPPASASAIPVGYQVPRAYAAEPFDIDKEINGSLKEIGPLLPKGKKPKLLTWSGNCSPWEGAVALAKQAGLRNINGGDTRFDSQYPLYASVAPVGLPVGKERQIYASSSNENTYTNLWSGNFFAHRYLSDTLKNTESPMRLKPINIYYHIYAGEKEAGLNALLANIEYARAQPIAPVDASHYTQIAEGFYDTQITALTPDSWRIDKRGALQTIRFDRHLLQSVDFKRSQGVIGQRPLQGSLYVYLDASVAQPVIALKANDHYFVPPEETIPYLLESRWLVSELRRGDKRADFTAQGYGPGEMIWQMPAAGRYRISIDGKEEAIVESVGRLLQLKLERDAREKLHISITPAPKGAPHA
jgi:polysaccharide biosynthesis protein PelA